MKQLFQLLFIVFVFIQNGDCQSLVVEGNQWNIVTYPTFTPDISSRSVRIGSDTMVNDLIYNKIDFTSDSLGQYWLFPDRMIRQDSSKKVFVKEYNNEEYLLYDFGLQLNDTFYIDEYCSLVVTEIDTVFLNNGEARKRMKMSKSDYIDYFQYWIDGVGTNLGLLNHFAFCLTDYSDALLCFYNDTELLYPESPPFCFLTSAEELTRNEFKVSPNPVNDVLLIESENEAVENYSIYNLSGQLITGGNPKNDLKQITVSGLESGLYLLILQSDDGSLYSHKFVKSN